MGGRCLQLSDAVRDWATQTLTPEGNRVVDIPWVRTTLARVHARLEAMKVMNWRMAYAVHTGALTPAAASSAKVYGTEVEIEAYRLLMDVLGRAGYLRRGSPGAVLGGRVEQAYRDAPVQPIVFSDEGVQAGGRFVPTEGTHNLRLNFARGLDAQLGRKSLVSVVDVIDGSVNPDRFRDKIVFIGATAESFRDNFDIYHLLPAPESEIAQDLVWCKASRPMQGAASGLFFRLSEGRAEFPDETITKATMRDGFYHGIHEIEADVVQAYCGHHQYDWVKPRRTWLDATCPVYIDFGDDRLVRRRMGVGPGHPRHATIVACPADRHGKLKGCPPRSPPSPRCEPTRSGWYRPCWCAAPRCCCSDSCCRSPATRCWSPGSRRRGSPTGRGARAGCCPTCSSSHSDRRSSRRSPRETARFP